MCADGGGKTCAPGLKQESRPKKHIDSSEKTRAIRYAGPGIVERAAKETAAHLSPLKKYNIGGLRLIAFPFEHTICKP